MSLDTTLDAVDSSLQTLAAFISANIDGLTVLQEWPYGNQAIAMPSLTISTTVSNRTPEMPWEVSKTAPDENGIIVVNEVTANYDTKFQLDLWCKNKLQRNQFTSLILALFNSQQSQSLACNPNSVSLPDGLSLPMNNYFGEYARFEIESHECIDDEAAAQRQERREKIMVLVNVREIRQRSYYAIKQIQVQQGVGSTSAQTDQTEQSNF